MKKTLLTSVVLSAMMAGSAMAADMAVKAPYMKAPPMPVFSWTGFYLGGQSGCGWTNAPNVTSVNSETADDLFAITTESQSGCFAGAQVGADYQFAGGFVVGVVADIGWGKISGFHQAVELDGPGANEAAGWETKLTSLGTVRGRLGYAINGGLPILGGISWMPYFTGGWAWANSKVSAIGDAGTFTSDSQTLGGWTIGGGIEYAINPSLSWRAEYLYTRFGSKSYAVTLDDDPGVVPGITLGNTNLSVIKTGLTWRLGH